MAQEAFSPAETITDKVRLKRASWLLRPMLTDKETEFESQGPRHSLQITRTLPRDNGAGKLCLGYSFEIPQGGALRPINWDRDSQAPRDASAQLNLDAAYIPHPSTKIGIILGFRADLRGYGGSQGEMSAHSSLIVPKIIAEQDRTYAESTDASGLELDPRDLWRILKSATYNYYQATKFPNPNQSLVSEN